MHVALWTSLAAKARIELDGTKLSRLEEYLDLLIAWNEKMNLTRITDRAEAAIKHVADALTLLPLLPARADDTAERSRANLQRAKRGWTLADVGTGGGVPGIPLAIARPDVAVTLIDSTKKKLLALTDMARELDLKNVRTLHARLDAAGPKHLDPARAHEPIGPFDVVTARGVAELSTLVGWCAPITRGSGAILAMKGPRAKEELEAAALNIHRARRFSEVHEPGVEELPGHVVVILRGK